MRLSPISYRKTLIFIAFLGVCVFGGIMANTDGSDQTGALTSTEAAQPLPDPLLVELDTSKGKIVLQLEPQSAPFSVDNFLEYVANGYYSGTIFHRVIEGFMIQGGGFTTNYERKQTNPPVQNEANNGVKNQKYTIAMARTSAPHSATAQFFINAEDNDYLDYTEATTRGWGYAVFGRVVEGKDVVDTISQVDTGAGGPFSRDAPREQIIINNVSVLYPQQQNTAADPNAPEPTNTSEPNVEQAKNDDSKPEPGKVKSE